MSEPLLQVSNLVKDFELGSSMFAQEKRLLRAVNDVSFTLDRGDILSLVGESGCGKSTTARLALRLIEPSSGSSRFNGQELTRLPHDELLRLRREMQIVFQDPYSSLNPRMTIQNILAEPLSTHDIVPKAQYKERVAESLSLVGLSPSYANRYAHEFSGGQRQRIGIARALASNPKLIVCDEPISALDVSIQAQIVNLLKDLQEQFGLSYLFITHDLRVVRQISTNVAVMYLGRIVESGTVTDIFERSEHPYTQALFSAIPNPNPAIKRKRILLKGDVPSPLKPPSGCVFHTRCPKASSLCSEQAPGKTELSNKHYCFCHHI